MNRDSQAMRDYERQELINSAVQAADRILMESSEGGEEELDVITLNLAAYMLLMVKGIQLKNRAPFTNLSRFYRAHDEVIAVLKRSSLVSDPVVFEYVYFEITKAFIEKAGVHFYRNLMKKDLLKSSSPE